MNRIGILIFDDVEELDAIGPFQVFGTARGLFPELFDVSLIAAGSDSPVRCVNGLRILPDFSFASAPPNDVLVVPGGIGTRRVAADPGAVEWIAEAARRARWVASVCTGARLTLAAGVAAGRRITTHWSAIQEIREQGCAEVLENVRFVRDGNVIHSAGVSAGIDMALWLVGELAGDPQAARDVQKVLEYYPSPPYAYLA